MRDHHQESLICGGEGGQVNPMAEHLYARLVDGDQIDHGQWLRAHAEGSFVGTCRECGGLLRPFQPEQTGHLTIYEAQCVSCGHGVLAPGGRTLRRSGQHKEMPGGWWERRTEQHKAGKRGGAT